jgi:ABC-type Fe3+ transport system substrate-binding protein
MTIRIATLAAVLSLAAGVAGAQAPAVTLELQKIIDAAKKERVLELASGVRVLGGSETADRAKSGMKRMFGVEPEFLWGQSSPFAVVGNRLATEYRAGQPATADLWTAGTAQLVPQLKLDMLQKINWTQLYPERIKPEQVQADGVALKVASGIVGILYNAQTGADFGKVEKLDELLQPKFKDRFGITPFANGFDVLATKSLWGEAKTIDYVAKLAKQTQGMIGCGAEDRIASGEFQALVLDCGGGGRNFEQFRGKLALNILREAAQLQSYYVSIPKHAKHPNMAILYTLYVNTPEGQNAMYDAWGINLYEYPETQIRREIASFEKQGYQFTYIDVAWWQDHSGIVESGIKLARVQKEEGTR